MDRYLEWGSRSQASIASHSLLPIETPMCPLCSGLYVKMLSLPLSLLFSLGRAKGEMDGLCPQQAHPLTAELTARPVPPKDRLKSRCWRRLSWSRGFDGPKNGTDLPWLLRHGGLLTLCSKRTGTAMRHPCSVDHAH
jgi:hypothetical protein